MKKANKKILFVLTVLLICICSLTMLSAYAADDCDEHDDVEYIFENLPEHVINAILGKDDGFIGIAPYNLLCLVMNHTKQIGAVEQWQHYYYATDPKCKVTISYVEYCTRTGCDYFWVTDQIIYRTACHG